MGLRVARAGVLAAGHSQCTHTLSLSPLPGPLPASVLSIPLSFSIALPSPSSRLFQTHPYSLCVYSFLLSLCLSPVLFSFLHLFSLFTSALHTIESLSQKYLVVVLKFVFFFFFFFFFYSLTQLNVKPRIVAEDTCSNPGASPVPSLFPAYFEQAGTSS